MNSLSNTITRAEAERINPPGVSDKYVRLDTLKLATADDLNTMKNNKLVKNVGLAFWVETGRKLGDNLYKYRLSKDSYQSTWVKELLGRRIYVVK